MYDAVHVYIIYIMQHFFFVISAINIQVTVMVIRAFPNYRTKEDILNSNYSYNASKQFVFYISYA